MSVRARRRLSRLAMVIVLAVVIVLTS